MAERIYRNYDFSQKMYSYGGSWSKEYTEIMIFLKKCIVLDPCGRKNIQKLLFFSKNVYFWRPMAERIYRNCYFSHKMYSFRISWSKEYTEIVIFLRKCIVLGSHGRKNIQNQYIVFYE